MDAKTLLLAALMIIAAALLTFWYTTVRRKRARHWRRRARHHPSRAIGHRLHHQFPRHAGHRLLRHHDLDVQDVEYVRDEKIPGTLNVGHATATFVQALIYITIVEVEFMTLVTIIAAAMVGAWLGAGVVCGLPIGARCRSAWASRCSGRHR